MDVPEEINEIINKKKEIRVIYKNWRGEVSERRIIPKSIFLGSTKWHPEEQWLVHVWDLDKNEYRDYSLKDIQKWLI